MTITASAVTVILFCEFQSGGIRRASLSVSGNAPDLRF
jgi:hypothetical protein